MNWRLVDENLRRAMRHFSASTDRGEVRDMPGVTLVSSGIDYSVFNSAMLSSPVPGADGDLDRRAAAASVHFSMRKLGWSFWLCEELLDPETRRRTDDILYRRGLRRMAEAPGMVADALAPPERPLPALEYRRVIDEQSRIDYCHVSSIGFHLPFAIARAIYGAAPYWESEYRGWVGYRNRLPVTTAATLVTGGVIGLYSVATLPEYRRQGYAEAIARHALSAARADSGVDRYVLQSTPAGHALYERMGYRGVANFVIYVS